MTLDCNEIIADRLWVGSYPEVEDVEELRHMAITAVVSLQDERDIAEQGISMKRLRQAFTEAGIELRQVAVRDFDKKALSEKLTRCVAEIVAALAPSPARVYLHCTAGINRAPTAAAAYMVRSLGMAAQEAYDHVVARRYCRPYLDVIEEYAASLNETSPG